ncbi:Mitochondrial translocator assembly and maintenance protein 41 [Rhizophlyctis rosea]|nr:Mitochondrial translocator assembly and maintenance protein 41 [Rhizophlyctis rosea]
MDRLFHDLTEWETFYLAGRLHKPVRTIREDARITIAARKNLRSAVRTALLLLPNQFTEEELFLTVAGLSYKACPDGVPLTRHAGDVRMSFGENPHKVYNIVHTQMDAFREIYKPIIEDLPNTNYLADGTTIVVRRNLADNTKENTLTFFHPPANVTLTNHQQDDHPRLRGTLIQKLPKKMYNQVLTNYRARMVTAGKISQLTGEAGEEPLLSQGIATEEGVGPLVEQSLKDVSRWPAIAQTLKGFITAGPGRSLSYIGEKLQKRWAAK